MPSVVHNDKIITSKLITDNLTYRTYKLKAFINTTPSLSITITCNNINYTFKYNIGYYDITIDIITKYFNSIKSIVNPTYMFYADTDLTNAITTLNDFINASDVYFNTNLVSNNVIESNKVYTNYLNITNNSLFINAPTYYFILIGNYSTFEVGNTYVIMNDGINLNIDLTNYNKILKFSNNRLYYCLNIEDLTFKEIVIPENIVVKDITTGLYFIYNKTNDNGYWIQLTQSGNNHSDIVNYSGVYTNKNGEKEYTKASGDSSHAEGYNTTASGNKSHAEGANTTASGMYSHAEGGYTTASGMYSHAEGFNTTASGSSSHAEGSSTTASGSSSHAEGHLTVASGNYSHAEGANTTANQTYQTVVGKYNTYKEEENNKVEKLFVVGNGSSTTSRSDAFYVDYSNNAYVNNNLYCTNLIASYKNNETINGLPVIVLTDSNVSTTVFDSTHAYICTKHIYNATITLKDKDNKDVETKQTFYSSVFYYRCLERSDGSQYIYGGSSTRYIYIYKEHTLVNGSISNNYYIYDSFWHSINNTSYLNNIKTRSLSADKLTITNYYNYANVVTNPTTYSFRNNELYVFNVKTYNTYNFSTTINQNTVDINQTYTFDIRNIYKASVIENDNCSVSFTSVSNVYDSILYVSNPYDIYNSDLYFLSSKLNYEYTNYISNYSNSYINSQLFVNNFLHASSLYTPTIVNTLVYFCNSINPQNATKEEENGITKYVIVRNINTNDRIIFLGIRSTENNEKYGNLYIKSGNYEYGPFDVYPKNIYVVRRKPGLEHDVYLQGYLVSKYQMVYTGNYYYYNGTQWLQMSTTNRIFTEGIFLKGKYITAIQDGNNTDNPDKSTTITTQSYVDNQISNLTTNINTINTNLSEQITQLANRITALENTNTITLTDNNYKVNLTLNNNVLSIKIIEKPVDSDELFVEVDGTIKMI